jgi:hypothetical protein
MAKSKSFFLSKTLLRTCESSDSRELNSEEGSTLWLAGHSSLNDIAALQLCIFINEVSKLVRGCTTQKK